MPSNKKPSEAVFVTRPNLPSFSELSPFLKELLETKLLTNNGRFVQQLEKELAGFFGVRHCIAFSNGTLALELLLRTIKKKGEVITTPFTFPATIHAIVAAGHTPVFADIDAETFNLSPENAAVAVSEKTIAILPVNVFGNPCDIEAFEKIARENSLTLFFDSAHAFHSSLNGKKIGCFGDAEMFSFHATKLFTTIEGGAVATNNQNLANELALLRNFGIASEENVLGWGTNAKMNEISAVFGLLNLKKISGIIKKLTALHKVYHRELDSVPFLRFQKIQESARTNCQYFPVLIETHGNISRDALCSELKKNNVFARKYFFPACNTIPPYNALESAQKQNLPNATIVSDSILCLPLYAGLEKKQVVSICGLIKDFIDSEKQKQ